MPRKHHRPEEIVVKLSASFRMLGVQAPHSALEVLRERKGFGLESIVSLPRLIPCSWASCLLSRAWRGSGAAADQAAAQHGPLLG